MKRPPGPIASIDFPDTVDVIEHDRLKVIPALTRRNFDYLIERHNELAKAVDILCDRLSIPAEGVFKKGGDRRA